MTEYQREFTQLSKYAPEMLVTEEEKCRKFEDGLNDYIQTNFTGFSHDDYSKIMTCALNVERFRGPKGSISLHYRDQLKLPVVRLLYQDHQ